MNTVFLTFAIFGMSSGTEWIIIGLAILLLFGGRKIPELMKGLGGGIKEFKKATKDDSTEESSSAKEQNKE
jgi:sec-independent protein translocase protein TatA